MTPPVITPELLALSEGVAELFPLESGKLGRIASGNHLSAQNEEREPHVMTRKSTGCGLDDYKQVVCSCGFVGPKRYEHENFMSANLRGDEAIHRSSVRGWA